MYVTIARAPDGRVVSRGTRERPRWRDPAQPGRVTAYTGLLCPPDAIDRATGTLYAIADAVIVEASFAAAVAATEVDPDLSGPAVAVLAHPHIGALLILGPFDDGAALHEWWNWPGNRIVRSGIVCVPLPLNPTDPPATGEHSEPQP